MTQLVNNMDLRDASASKNTFPKKSFGFLLHDDPNCLYCIKRLGNILLRIYCEYFRPQDRIKHLFNCEKKKHLCHLDKYRRSQFRAGDIYGPHKSEDKVGLSLNSPNTILSPLYLTSDQTFHLEE